MKLRVSSGSLIRAAIVAQVAGLVLSGVMVAQGSAPAATSAAAPTIAQQMDSIQKQAETLGLRIQLLYEKLHGLTEFQEYIQAQQQAQNLQQAYSALQKQQAAEAKKAEKK
jgi:uncharacterized protein YlxW (UPF0749 family)